jgi:hypothetical protein
MQGALTDFKNDIARIDAVAVLLVTPAALTSTLLPAELAIRCGAVVLLSGYFESFIRALMEAFIRSVNGLSKPMTKFPERMKYVHFQSGANVLSRELKKARKTGDISLCVNIASRLASINDPLGSSFLWESFAETNANPGSGTVHDVLADVGVDHAWPKINAAASAGSGNLELFLSNFMAMRNECAHSGITASPPTPGDLMDYGDRLSRIAYAMVTILEAKLAEYAAL